jgi:hypothetical protein
MARLAGCKVALWDPASLAPSDFFRLFPLGHGLCIIPTVSLVFSLCRDSMIFPEWLDGEWMEAQLHQHSFWGRWRSPLWPLAPCLSPSVLRALDFCSQSSFSLSPPRPCSFFRSSLTWVLLDCAKAFKFERARTHMCAHAHTDAHP